MKVNMSSLRLAAWLVALFLVILGAKLWVIQLYGSPLPVWDQWSEADRFFRPWLEGRLTWHDWFAPHNEHRIVFTRLLDLSVIQLNGYWDTLLQMTINAAIHAGYACALTYCLWIFLGQKNIGLICLLIAPFFSLPFAAENTVRGFDSQQYLVAIGSLATLLGLGFAPPGSRWWWLGLVAAILNLFTMASGLFAPLAVAGLMGLRALRERKVTREQAATFATGVVVFVLGLVVNPKTPADHSSRANSLTDFTTTLARNLSWPFLDQPAMIAVVCLPLVLLLVFYLRPDFSQCRAAEFLLGFGLWGFLQSAALAYGRANYNDAQASRYLDALCIVAMAAVFSVVLLAERWKRFHVPDWAASLLPLAFAGLIFLGTWQLSRQTVVFFLTSVKVDDLIEEESVRAFAATDDPSWLQDKLVPLPNPAWTITVLRDPKLSAILPPICRAPDQNAGDGHGPLSAAAKALRGRATTGLLAGLVLFLCLSVIDVIDRRDKVFERRFVGAVCLLTGLLTLVRVWPNRNLDATSQNRELHRTLGFHFMARSDYKLAALQFTAVWRSRTNNPEGEAGSTILAGDFQAYTLARQNIVRVAATSDSNLVEFLNENLNASAPRSQ